MKPQFCLFSWKSLLMAGYTSCVALLFLGLTYCCHAAVPDGYILSIKPSCGNFTSGEDASVKIITDLRAEAKAVCANDNNVVFNNTDGVNLVLDVSYPDTVGTSKCVFKKRTDSRVFVITVYVSWGEPGNPVHAGEEEFFVTCTFDEHGRKMTTNETVDESLIAPMEIQRHLGDHSTSVFTLALSDVLGGNLDGQPVPLGRVVLLTATTDGSNGEKGIRPVGCDAVGSYTKRRYAVIRAGCGDGIVFSKTEGFVTNGLTARSPYFSEFDMADDPLVQFECNFTLCEDWCNGSSCSSERQRRSLGDGLLQTVYLSKNGTLIFLEDARQEPQKMTSNELIFCVALFAVGIATMLSVCISVFVYVRRTACMELWTAK